MNFTDHLTKEEIELRQEIIEAIINHPEAPVHMKEAYQPLVEKEVIVLDDKEDIISIYPISTVKTNKQVYVDEKTQPVYAMCAIDALGIHFTVHRPIKIVSEDQLTQEPITIEMENGQITNHAADDLFVLYKEVSCTTNCNVDCCPFIHFFNRRDHVETYLENNPHITNYKVLNLDESIEEARELFEV
ncbi:organomercurial lyase [Dolosicoccus paucivorans]|uniref:Alkylmercury lyase n=1 Tax=Dolosicoccus paucivorans TaxID=84521 RepID=A0A1G8J687_9LACT|nr:organomercurial lyase [Dolosicoccus paucivorans]PMB84142.1 alkylmercury lyase [Dolosicoccus paucivorans]PMC59098.1 alkylmercury lyase [Dolosicoccus paucivorans]SDI26631.1 Alkylmercury lyase [Dolosicoccus paucivorans]